MESLDALRAWLEGVARKPTALNDLQAIASEVATLRGLEDAETALVTTLAHATLADAFRADARGDRSAAADDLARCAALLLLLSDRLGERLGERLIARLRADLRLDTGGPWS